MFLAKGVELNLLITISTNNYRVIKQCLHAPMEFLKLGIILLTIWTTTLALRITLCLPRVDTVRAEGFFALRTLLGIIKQTPTDNTLHARQQLLIPIDLLYHRYELLYFTLIDL